MLVSAVLLVVVLLRSLRGHSVREPEMQLAIAAQRESHIAPALNGFALWNSIVLALMLAAYGYPIAQFLFVLPPHSAPAVDVTRPAAEAEVP